jgi:hypothetical protein
MSPIAGGVKIAVTGSNGGACGAGSHPGDRLQTLGIYAGTYMKRNTAALTANYARLYDVGSNRAQAATLKITSANDDGIDFDLSLVHRRADANSGSSDGVLHGHAKYTSVRNGAVGSGNVAVALPTDLRDESGRPVDRCNIVFAGFPMAGIDVTDSQCEPYGRNLESSGMGPVIAFGGAFSRTPAADER